MAVPGGVEGALFRIHPLVQFRQKFLHAAALILCHTGGERQLKAARRGGGVIALHPLLDGGTDLIQDLLRAVPDQHHELIAAYADSYRVCHQRPGQDVTDLLNGAVARTMTVGVVDLLEAVHVHHDAVNILFLRGVDALQTVVHVLAAKQTGQLVDIAAQTAELTVHKHKGDGHRQPAEGHTVERTLQHRAHRTGDHKVVHREKLHRNAIALVKFGDKLMVVGEREGLRGVARLLGNNAKQLSDTDFFPIAMGIVLGVLFGKINISFSDSVSFSPGLTGGVLMVALLLSAVGKTGPILWSMSGPANQLLRQLGLLLFLAEVGTSAGKNLVATFQESGLLLFGVGATITVVPMLVAVVVGRLVFKISLLDLLGTITGGMTSTPGLAAADSMVDSNIPSIFLGHSVNRAEKGQEVLLRVNVLFPVRGKQDVFTFLEMQPLMNIARLYFGQILMQDFRHGRTGYVCTFFRHARSVQVSAGMLRIAEVHIGNDVHNTAVGLLRQALVKAAVACLHMEDGDMQTFRAYHAQAGVRVSQHQHGIRFHLHHQLVAGVDNIPHRGTEVITDGIHIHIGVFQLQVTEEVFYMAAALMLKMPQILQSAVSTEFL